MKRCAAAWRTMYGNIDVGVVDVHSVRFPDVLAAGLLPAFRAAQSGTLAAQLPYRGLGFAILYLLLSLAGSGWNRPVDAPRALGSGLPGHSLGALRYDQRAAVYVAPFIAVEGLLLIGNGCARPAAETCINTQPSALAAIGLLAGALVLYRSCARLGRHALGGNLRHAPDPRSGRHVALLALAAGRIRWLAMITPRFGARFPPRRSEHGAPDRFIPIVGALTAVVIGRCKQRFGAAIRDHAAR